MVNTYAGKEVTAKRSRAVSREIRPALKKMHAEGDKPPTTRKGGGK